MTNPIVLLGVSKVINVAFDLFLAGLERAAIVNRVREMEASGSTPDEMTDMLIAMRKEAEGKAQNAIDNMPDDPK